MFEEITDSISNPKRREDYYHLSCGSGVELLRVLAAELTAQSPEIGAWAAGEIASLQLAGISSPTVASFDEYRDKYEDLNDQLDERASDASLASHYFAQVRRLGEMLSTKLKLRMVTDGATGDLPKTVAAITAVLLQLHLNACSACVGMRSHIVVEGVAVVLLPELPLDVIEFRCRDVDAGHDDVVDERVQLVVGLLQLQCVCMRKFFSFSTLKPAKM
ncbi:hypothetical protein AB1Y20_000996 [Prymnesium parvum]|uniref:Uncharacterized protein n=1 Tax=Prymnesium parvum TaxID=97485 RepID=A0AB34K8A0_PRYPA